jgi:hypothetical protein
MEDRRLMPSDSSLRTEDEHKGPPSKMEKDDMRKQRMRQGAIICPPLAFVLCCIARLLCWRGFYKLGVKHGKEAPLDLPKGIVLSPDELCVQFAGQAAKGAHSSPSSAKADGKELAGEWAGFRECEVVISEEQKGSVYVFDANSTQETYVVVEVRGCTSGPPLLPTRLPSGGLQWDAPDDRFMHLATYLAIAMRRLTGEDWSQKILPHMSGNYLVRYQAVVREEHWRLLWDFLMKPFNEQRSEYRRIHETHRAPDLFFGTKAKTCAPERKPDAGQRGGEQDASTTASDGGKREDDGSGSEAASGGGLPLSGPAEWLEFWATAEIPQQRTFVEFASHLSQTGLPPRSKSEPDLTRLVEESGA